MSAAAAVRLASSPPEDAPPVTAIPRAPQDHEALLAQMRHLAQGDARWAEGRCFALVYSAGEAHSAFLKEAHNLFFSENGLNPMAFQSLKRMESEVVRMASALMHGGEHAVGSMTSGGTESLLLAVKTYRDLARRKRPWIRRPELVVPKTAHVALDKAAHYFGVKLRHARVGRDFRVDVDHVRKLINRNTIAILGSAPQYPHGVIGPIEALGALALEKKRPLHVDACVGGFLLPWLERLGEPIPPWDFRVPGVTTISADLHKYGYCAKGASVLLHRDMKTMRHQFFVTTNWPGGIYAGPGVPGTRPGGPIAAAWAGLQAMGEAGYLHHTERALTASRAFKAGIEKISGVKLLGSDDATLVCFGSDDPAVDIYAVADQLDDRGWHADRQQHPNSIHLTVMSQHLDIVDIYLRDLQEAVDYVRAHPEAKSRGNAAMYGMMAKIPVRRMVKSAVLSVMEGMYAPGAHTADLSQPGAAGEGLMGQLVDKVAPKAVALIDELDALREHFKRGGAA